MALEIEYVDVEPSTTLVDQEVDAADLVNGDGAGKQAPPTEVNQVKEATAAPSEPVSFTPAPIIDPDGTVQKLSDHLEEISLQDRRLLAEQQHQIEISAAKEDHFSLAVRRSELENELKDIKADEKAALRNLRNLIKRGPNYPQPKSKIDEAVATGGEKSAIVVDDPSADDTWKLIATATIIDGIKGMGAKKAEAIISLAPTLGDLEELRAKAGIAFKSFKEVLPKGVGGEMADEIEERILTAVAKHKAGLEQAGEAGLEPAGVGDVASTATAD